jgi:hypothetical protein
MPTQASVFLCPEEIDVLTFKSRDGLKKLSPDHPAYGLMADLVQVLIDDFPEQPYNADDYGFVLLAEPGDEDRVLTELDMPWRLAEVPWEGASLRQGFFLAILVTTDDFGLVFAVPDEPWVDGELRTVLEEILD